MTYDDINSYTSHAGVFLHRAGQLMTSADTLFWNVKIRQADDPHRKDVARMDELLTDIGSCLDAVQEDLNALLEEMKNYRK